MRTSRPLQNLAVVAIVGAVATLASCSTSERTESPEEFSAQMRSQLEAHDWTHDELRCVAAGIDLDDPLRDGDVVAEVLRVLDDCRNMRNGEQA